MPEQTERLPADQDSDRINQAMHSDQIVDVQENLVYKGGFTGDAREIVESPAVAPEMLNQPGDLRRDLNEED
jgi:hypothetical protein